MHAYFDAQAHFQIDGFYKMISKSIAFILYYPGSLKFHPSITNSATLLAVQGYQIDIFKPFNSDEGDIATSGIRVIHGCAYTGNPMARPLSLRKLLYSILESGRTYSALIGIDAYGLLVASAAKSILHAPVIYFSLELLSQAMNACDVRTKSLGKRMGYSLHHALLKMIEKRLHGTAVLTLIQDQTRWNVLRRLNGIPDSAPVIFLPNSPFANADQEISCRSDYLKRKYNIDDRTCIVLYAGSLGVWTGIDRIAAAASMWPEKYVLVLHGRGLPKFIHDLHDTAAGANGKIILSLDQMVESEYEEMLRSADIGLSWYADREDPNVYYIGAGSGKLFYYLKHGLPVVTNRFPGLPEIVDKHSVGMCVEHENDIGQALEKITTGYARYSDNARASFAEYEFASCFSKVVAFLQSV